jgi:hypothetical protein
MDAVEVFAGQARGFLAVEQAEEELDVTHGRAPSA